MRIHYLLLFLFISSIGPVDAQDPISNPNTDSTRHGYNGLLLSGNGFINLEKKSNENTPAWHTSIFPILIWRISNKLFFESELAAEYEDKDLKTSIEYATLHYSFGKYLSIGAGKFICPFGTFQERMHPAWVNKFSEVPLGFNHDEFMVGPMSDIGIELRGGAPLGGSKINYAAYITNGPALSKSNSDPMMSGMMETGKLKDNNSNKAIGGRIGFLPLSNSSLEVGYSRLNADVGDDNDSINHKARTVMHSFDISYVKAIPTIKGIVDIKGQYNRVTLDKVNNGESNMDSMSNAAAMYNISQAYYMQIAFRPAMSGVKFLQKIEFAGQYSIMHLYEKDMIDDLKLQVTFGMNYWFSWRTVLKLAYQVSKTRGAESESAILLQFAVAHPHISFKKKKAEIK